MVCPTTFAAAYNNKAYALFLSQKLHLVRTKDSADPNKQDALFTELPVNAAKFTSARLEDLEDKG